MRYAIRSGRLAAESLINGTSNADAWQPEEALLLRAADECRLDSGISDRTYASLNRYFDLSQQLDIIATVGMYMTLATLIKTYQLQLEDR